MFVDVHGSRLDETGTTLPSKTKVGRAVAVVLAALLAIPAQAFGSAPLGLSLSAPPVTVGVPIPAPPPVTVRIPVPAPLPPVTVRVPTPPLPPPVTVHVPTPPPLPPVTVRVPSPAPPPKVTVTVPSHPVPVTVPSHPVTVHAPAPPASSLPVRTTVSTPTSGSAVGSTPSGGGPARSHPEPPQSTSTATRAGQTTLSAPSGAGSGPGSAGGAPPASGSGLSGYSNGSGEAQGQVNPRDPRAAQSSIATGRLAPGGLDPAAKNGRAATGVQAVRNAETQSQPGSGIRQDSPGVGPLPGIVSPAASETVVVVFFLLAGMLAIGWAFSDELDFWAHHGRWRSLRMRRPRL
jgi:hypothetical protein